MTAKDVNRAADLLLQLDIEKNHLNKIPETDYINFIKYGTREDERVYMTGSNRKKMMEELKKLAVLQVQTEIDRIQEELKKMGVEI